MTAKWISDSTVMRALGCLLDTATLTSTDIGARIGSSKQTAYAVLTRAEREGLAFRVGVTRQNRLGRRIAVWALTEDGVAAVLDTRRGAA